MVRRKRSESVGIRMEPDLKKASERAAEADHRSLASLIEKLLIEYTVKHGFLKRKPRA